MSIEPYSRDNPSPRSSELLTYYKQMHVEGAGSNLPPEKTFNGKSLLPHLRKIRKLALRTNSSTLLDYGSGKGAAYFQPGFFQDETGIYKSALDAMALKEVTCYDPGVDEFKHLPDGVFDGVISTDVLEHIPEEDIPWILEEIFSKASKFVFANIACHPAKKSLPNGENAHTTIKPASWWKEVIDKTPKNNGTIYRFELIFTPKKNRNLINRLFKRTTYKVITNA